MKFFWGLGAVICGALAAMVGGVVLDYAQRLSWVVPIGQQWLLLPIVTGLAGLLGGFVAVTMFSRYLKDRPNAGAARSTPRSATPRGLEHVPGMPTFDVEAIRAGQHQSPGVAARPGELSSPPRPAAEQGATRPREAGK